jgi:uncharacterized surface protein with fasciclin (FAS1) repeats
MRYKGFTALALAGALALSACGDDDSDAVDATTAPAESTATEETMTEETMTEETMTEETMTDDSVMEEPGDIVTIASSTEGFSTLVAAVTAADLVETLQGEGPFTVFAPTDEAFAALPEGVLDALLLPENKETLVKILTYHVVPGAVMSTDIAPGEVATVEGQSVELATDGGVTVNGANVVQADVVASNGVIHVIDAVILPPDVDPAAL